MADIQGHRNPWHPEIMKLNTAQLDFILEMYSLDHPDEMKFKRVDTETTTVTKARWYDVLTGNALMKFMASQVNMKVVNRKKQQEAEAPVIGPRRKIVGGNRAKD